MTETETTGSREAAFSADSDSVQASTLTVKQESIHKSLKKQSSNKSFHHFHAKTASVIMGLEDVPTVPLRVMREKSKSHKESHSSMTEF